MLVEENLAFWPNPPFWTGFQPVSSLHNRRYFFAFLQESEGKRQVSEKRDGEDAVKTTACPHAIVFCIPSQTYPLMALLTRFALAFDPASGLIAFARLKNVRLLCRLAC